MNGGMLCSVDQDRNQILKQANVPCAAHSSDDATKRQYLKLIVMSVALLFGGNLGQTVRTLLWIAMLGKSESIVARKDASVGIKP